MVRGGTGIKLEQSFLADEDDESGIIHGESNKQASAVTSELPDEDIEGGASAIAPRSRWCRWINMGTRERKTYSPEEQSDAEDESQGLLNGEIVLDIPAVAKGIKRNCHHRWLRRGNTILSVVAVLLILNLIFGSNEYHRHHHRHDPFKRWGQTGTTSEGLSWYPTDFLRDIDPIPCHSHNDYWRKVPMFSALYAGCTSIEADVWKYGNDLLVGHNTASLTRNRTFQSLYINPLVELLERQNPSTEFYNGTMHGVFDTDPDKGLTLLVDVKTNGETTWPFVVEQLEPLRKRDWLTYVQDGKLHQRPVTVVGTGETPFNILISNTTYRDYFFDAPLDQMYEPAPDKDSSDTPDNIPLAPASLHKRGQGNSGTSPSDSYTKENSFYASTEFNAVIGRIWWGNMTDHQLELVRGHVRGAHRRGLKVRYWGTPNWPVSVRNNLWNVLLNEGADVLNVDDLKGVSKGVW